MEREKIKKGKGERNGRREERREEGPRYTYPGTYKSNVKINYIN